MSSFVLEVPLRNLRPSVIYSVPCDRIVQKAYWSDLLSFPFSRLTMNFTVKQATSWFSLLEKFKFVIRVDIPHPEPSLFFYDLLLSLWCFSVVVSYHFHVSVYLKLNFVPEQKKKLKIP